MDGENHGNPLFFNGWFEGKPTTFGNTHIHQLHSLSGPTRQRNRRKFCLLERFGQFFIDVVHLRLGVSNLMIPCRFRLVTGWSTQLKKLYTSQFGSVPEVWVKIQNESNQHPGPRIVPLMDDRHWMVEVFGLQIKKNRKRNYKVKHVDYKHGHTLL